MRVGELDERHTQAHLGTPKNMVGLTSFSVCLRDPCQRERERQDNLIPLPGFQNCKLLYLESVWLCEIDCGSHCYGHIDVQHLRKTTEDHTSPGSSHTLMHSNASEPIIFVMNAYPLSLHGKTRPPSKPLATSSVLPQNPILLHAHILPSPDTLLSQFLKLEL